MIASSGIRFSFEFRILVLSNCEFISDAIEIHSTRSSGDIDDSSSCLGRFLFDDTRQEFKGIFRLHSMSPLHCVSHIENVLGVSKTRRSAVPVSSSWVDHESGTCISLFVYQYPLDNIDCPFYVSNFCTPNSCNLLLLCIYMRYIKSTYLIYHEWQTVLQPRV